MAEDFTDQYMDDVTEATTSVPVELLIYDIVIPILGIFILLLNLLVVISSGIILKRGQQPRSTYLFLGNVALSDLLTGIAVIFGQYYPNEYRDEHSCAIHIGLIVSSTLTSVYSVGLIGLDRFLYILYGLQYQRYIYPNRARFLIVLTWILGLIIGFLPAMGWRGDTNNGKQCWFIVIAPHELVLLTSFIGLLPIILVVVLYSIILYTAVKKINQLKKAANEEGSRHGSMRLFTGRRSGQSERTTSEIETSRRSGPSERTTSEMETGRRSGQSERTTSEMEPLRSERRTLSFFRRKRSTTTPAPEPQAPSRRKAIKVVIFTTGSFVLTWIPFFIASTWYVFCNVDQTPELCSNLQLAIAGPLAVLGFANSLINPIIYAWWHNGFRQSVKEFWRKCCRRGRPAQINDDSRVASISTQNTNLQSTSGVSTTQLNS